MFAQFTYINPNERIVLIFSVCFVTVIHIMVLAADEDHHVPTDSTLHDGRTRLFVDNVLRKGRATRTDLVDDKNMQ